MEQLFNFLNGSFQNGRYAFQCTITGSFLSNLKYGSFCIVQQGIGVFAVGEVCRNLTRVGKGPAVIVTGGGHVFKGTGRIIWKYKWNLARGPIIGTIIGALPGAGSDMAAWVSYAVAKKFSKAPEKFLTGHPEGLVAASSSNGPGFPR